MRPELNPISKTHKTDYQAKRDALIPEAEVFANTTEGKSRNHSQWAEQWSVAFLGEMDRLAKARGIVKRNE